MLAGDAVPSNSKTSKLPPLQLHLPQELLQPVSRIAWRRSRRQRGQGTREASEEDRRPVLVTTSALTALLDEHGDVTLTVVGVAQDDGTVVIFTTAEGVNLAVDHRSAQHLVDLLQQDGEVPVLAADWQVL